jgi:hypothetical protein
MRHLSLLVLAASLTGCGSAPQTPEIEVPKTVYGMYIGVGPELENQLADEASLHLARVCPPHQCLLNFQQAMPKEDRFGLRLMSALQRDGYSVRQWHDPSMSPQCGQTPKVKKDKDTPRSVAACYLVDDVLGMTRLSLFADGEAWSRLFAVDKGKLRPTGVWTQQKAE